jgi:hypothetical protein
MRGGLKMTKQLLWCVHVAGPDEVRAAKDYEEARREADELNYCIAPHRGVARHEFDPFIRAAPMIWPYDAEIWAKDLLQHMGSRVAYAAKFDRPIWEREAPSAGRGPLTIQCENGWFVEQFRRHPNSGMTLRMRHHNDGLGFEMQIMPTPHQSTPAYMRRA